MRVCKECRKFKDGYCLAGDIAVSSQSKGAESCGYFEARRKPENRRTFRIDQPIMDKLNSIAAFYFENEDGARTKALIRIIEKEYERIRNLY